MYLKEKTYREHPEKNKMGTAHAYITTTVSMIITGGRIGYFTNFIIMTGTSQQQEAQFLASGAGVGLVGGVIVVHKQQFSHYFKQNRLFYYSLPFATLCIGTFYSIPS